MKKFLVILFLLALSIASFSQSEGFRIGARFGLGESRFSGMTSTAQMEEKLSLSGGISASQQFTNNFGLMMNALFVNKGAMVKGTTYTDPDFFGNRRAYTYTDDLSLFYAEVPVMAKVSVGFKNFHIKAFAGPSVNFHLFGIQTRTYQDQTYNDNNGFEARMKDNDITEFAGVYGIGFEAETKDNQLFYLDLRFSNAFDSFRTIEGRNAKNQYFSVGIGYEY